MDNIWQLALNSSGAALVTGLFVFYLRSRDRSNEKVISEFNSMIKDYLRDSISVKKELAEKIQKNTDVLEHVEKSVSQQNKTINFANTVLKKLDGKVTFRN